MTNPDNIVRTRARNGGRASIYEANAWCQPFDNGILEGNGVTQNTSPDMTVLVGGTTSNPDVLIATNAAGYNIALDVVGQKPITITAPATNSRIAAIVAYTDDLSLASSDTNVTGNPSSCGLIVVNGDTAASPVAPSDSAIRTAITADGATGSQAAYAIIATITVSSSTTTITDSLINTQVATLRSNLIAPGAITADNIDFATLDAIGSYSTEEVETPYKWIDGKTIYRRTYVWTGTLKNGDATTIATDPTLATAKAITRVSGTFYVQSTKSWGGIPYLQPYYSETNVGVLIRPTGEIYVLGGSEAANSTRTMYITIEYVK